VNGVRASAERGEGLDALRSILTRKPAAPPGERCDYCAAPVGDGHGHLVDLTARRILCACRPCYLVFEPQGAAQGRYKPIPQRYAEIEDFVLDAAQWDALAIPIGLVFLFRNSLEGKMGAFYPGPAGATESQLPLDGWTAIVAAYPILETVADDVEAVLIDRRNPGARCFIVPIDAAYELVGTMRSTWRGFDGGAETRARIDAFFETIVDRSQGRVTARRS
jgi:Family of unknown function (DUF5947)